MIRRIIDALAAPFRWIFGWILRFVAVPRKLWGLSLPTRAAVFVLLGSYLVYALATYLQLSESKLDFPANLWSWLADTKAVALLLIPVLAVVTYFTFLSWLQVPKSEYKNLELAWLHSVRSLEKAGFPFDANLPVFLVLGCADHVSAKRFMNTTGIDFVVDGEPAGDESIRVYANKEAIFVVPSDGVGAICRLNSENSRGMAMTGQQTFMARSIINSAEEGFGRGTLTGSDLDNLRQTLAFGGTVFAATSRDANGLVGKRELQRSEILTAGKRLELVCKRLKSERSGRVAVNAILVLVDVDVLDGSCRSQVPDVVVEDLDTVRKATEVNAATVFLTTGMDTDDGFMEMVGKMSSRDVRGSRFGYGIKKIEECRSTSNNMEALAGGCRRAFEDQVFRIMQKEGPSNRAGNWKLYSLLCRTRGEIFRSIRDTLKRLPMDDGGLAQSFLISGWYFAATGERASEQAFVGAVIQKLRDHAAPGKCDCEWLSHAWELDEKYWLASQILFVISGCLLLAIVYKIFTTM